jgi:CRP/FNR family cyclic AMP-dependent transcriptional regulator
VKLDPSAFLAAPELILALEDRSTAISCGEDRVLFLQGEIPAGLYILNQGETTLTMTSPNGEQIMSIQAQAGALLGLPSLIGNEPCTLSAIARNGAQLSFVPRDEFISHMRADPQLALKMLKVLAAEVRSARQALSEI